MLHRFLPAALLGVACAPLFGQATLRAPLQAWLAHQQSPSLYEDWFVPFRKALLLAKSTKCTLVPNGGTDAQLYDLVPAIQPLDDGMEVFTADAGVLPKDSAANLLKLAAAFRANGDSLEPLLPWLLLLQKRAGADARIELCLFEAWGTDALDCVASKAAAERCKKLDEAPLLTFLGEAKAFPANKPGTAQRLVNQLCVDRIDKGLPLGPGALCRALVAEFEKDYELQMQLGDFRGASSSLETMLLADPRDWSPQLLLEASGAETKGTRFADRYKDASPEVRAAIDARLWHLGLALVAPGQSVAAVAQAARAGPLDFFRNDLANRSKKLDAPIKAAEQAHAAKVDAVQGLRDDIEELERKIKKHERIVGMRREVRDYRQRVDDKKVEIVKLDAEVAKLLEVKARLETERQDLLNQIDAVKKQRSEFKLQATEGAGKTPTAGDPPATPRLEPPATPAHPTPLAPPPVEFDVALPQVNELLQATADLESAQLARARTALEAVKVALARAPADPTTQRLIAVTSYRLGECLQQLAMQKAKETRNDVEAERLFRAADSELASLTGDDFATAREGSSLKAAALRVRLLINSTLFVGYRGLATAEPKAQTYRTKRDAYQTTANQLFAELKKSFATATLPDGRRIVDVAREEAAALAR